jgi:RNA polymerase sigma factor (sigma-70 family)
MQEKSDARLLRDYATGGDESAFRELVARHTDFVYSAALRQVNSPDAACDIAQSVLIDLARKSRAIAEKLPEDASLMGWLHRGTRYAALNHFRDEQRRTARERQAMEQLLTDSESAPDWEAIRPVLDEALDALGDDEREALLLRYFKNADFRAVGQTLGISDDAAQKRVSRAVDKLREYFAKRGVTVGAGGLAAVISANSVQAAPAGLAAAISSAAIVGGAAVTTTGLIAATTTTIAMTTLQKILVTAALAAAVGAGLYEKHEVSGLQEQVRTLQAQQTPMAGQIAALQDERDKATNLVEALTEQVAEMKKHPAEVVKLRGDVGRLRQERNAIASSNALSKLTASPEMRKMIRDQQKAGLSALYEDLAKSLNLTDDQKGKFNDLLADHVMDDIDRITELLRDGKSSAEVNQAFNDQDKALEAKLQELIGPDGVAQYEEYSKNMLGKLMALQFGPMLTADDPSKKDIVTRVSQDVQNEMQAEMAAAGLPPNYQSVPILNFRNIASEQIQDQSLNMVDSVFTKVEQNAASYMTPGDLKKLQDFHAQALQTSKMTISMNRTMMAPIAK